MKDERARLRHAIDAVDAIQRYTAGGREAFFSDDKTRDAVIRNIEILGQAVKGISDEAHQSRNRKSTSRLLPVSPFPPIPGPRTRKWAACRHCGPICGSSEYWSRRVATV